MDTRRDVFQAIADPTRRNILSLLLDEPQNVNALAEKFDMSRQAVSLHIKILSECQVININQIGRERICQIKVKKLEEVADWLEPFRQMWEDKFNQLDDVIEKLKNKTNDEDNLH